MTIGTAMVLLAVGAILKWAVTAHASWIDVQEAGLILFIIGLLGLVLAILYTFHWSPAGRRTRAVRETPEPLQ